MRYYNMRHYFWGNPIKAICREHYCYRCGSKLSIIKHNRVVSQKSAEAKYYSFSDSDGDMVGACKFVHKVYYCQKCSQKIEVITQLSYEDIDILIKKVQKYFCNKGRSITIKKCFENSNNEIVEECIMESLSNICLFIEEKDKDTLVYKIPKCRKPSWERPYYFPVSKRKLIRFIQIYNIL